MKKNIKILVCVLFFIPFYSNGQVLTPPDPNYSENPDTVIDGAYEKIHNVTKPKAYKYPKIKEKDIVWSRTIWREIDLRQKINHHFYYPAIQKRKHLNPEKMSLIDVVLEALQFGDSNTYRAFATTLNQVPGNEFKYGTLSREEIMSIGTKIPEKMEMVDDYGDPIYDENGEIMYELEEVDPFNRTEVKSWIIKEEWYFDKHRSTMDVRIIGLCPVRTYIDKATGEEEQKELFWIYFPEWRDLLVQTKVANFTKNNAQQRSYLGILEKRMFGSRIIQESNIMNRSVTDYMIGLDALLESDRIKQEIFNIEHDMWEY